MNMKKKKKGNSARTIEIQWPPPKAISPSFALCCHWEICKKAIAEIPPHNLLKTAEGAHIHLLVLEWQPDSTLHPLPSSPSSYFPIPQGAVRENCKTVQLPFPQGHPTVLSEEWVASCLTYSSTAKPRHALSFLLLSHSPAGRLRTMTKDHF